MRRLIGLFPNSKFVDRLWYRYYRLRRGKSFIGMYMRIPIFKSENLTEEVNNERCITNQRRNP